VIAPFFLLFFQKRRKQIILHLSRALNKLHVSVYVVILTAFSASPFSDGDINTTRKSGKEMRHVCAVLSSD
jgi:hypothetical protein